MTMRERPILFKSELVAGILANEKTQTRRTNGLDYFSQNDPDNWHARFWDGFAYFHYKNCPTEREVRCPYGKPGDRLWVRETWKPKIVHSCFDMACDCETVWVDYPAGGEGKRFYGEDIPDNWSMPKAALKGKPVPSLHMPRWAARVLLEVTKVRIERLDDCSENDAEAEGIGFLRDVPDVDETLSARQLYECLWDSINGAGSWTANPWVWTVEFRRISE